MNIEVTKEYVKILDGSNLPHEGEYNVNKCYFTFDEYTESFTFHTAIFTILSSGKAYTSDILNNECAIPTQVLQEEYDTVKMGVYSYNTEISDEEVILKNRNSPHYDTFVVQGGSYEEGAETPTMITPTQYEEYSTLLQAGLDKIDEAVTEANNLDLDAEKVNDVTTITITKKDGTEKSVEVLDGVSLENIEIVNRNLEVTYGGETENLGQVAPNIQVGTTTTVTPSMVARVENVGTDLNPILNFYIPKGDAGSIKFEIVEQLPTTGIKEDTIYLVPYAVVTVQSLPSTGVANTIYIVESTGKRYVYESNQWIEVSSNNKYAEYIWVNDSWESLGGIDVDVDLSDYYTKSETDGLLSGKQNVIDTSHKLNADLVDDGNATNKFVTSSDKTTWSAKYDKPSGGIPSTDMTNEVQTSLGKADTALQSSDLTDYVKNTDYAQDNKGGVVKTGTYGFGINSSGKVFAQNIDYATYQSEDNIYFVSKGTLENVITGKGLVSNTDYADISTGGVIKTNANYATEVSNGSLRATTKNYTWYQSANNGAIIGKGTLENVITGKDLTTKAYVDGLVGDLENILTTLDIGSGV